MRRAARARAALAALAALLLARPPMSAAQELEAEVEALAPRFVAEPAVRVFYAAEHGVRVACGAHGQPPPAVRWLDAHGEPLHDAPATRRVHTNGTLELLGGARAAGGGVVRCLAENAHGAALSRDVLLQPVEAQGWRPVLEGGAAARGGVAALPCRLPAALPPAAVAEAELFWFRGDARLDIPPPAPDSRLVVAGDTLLIRDVRREDAGEYSCAARPPRPVAAAAPARSRPAHLTVVAEGATERHAPRAAGAAEQVVPRGAHFCLWCGAEAHPPGASTHAWLRARGGGLQAAGAGEGAWLWAGGAALCARAEPALQGTWLCKTSDAQGDATRQLHLRVLAVPRLTVSPGVVVAAAGGAVRFTCAADMEGDWVLGWLHDGAPAGAGATLDVRPVSLAQRGVYQCVARDARGTVLAQASAELRLGDSGPEMVYTFIEQALRGGGAVSLRCVAAGAPPPRLLWLRDGLPLDPPRTHRYAISSETTARGDVVSTLNVTAARAEDGGRYTCRAESHLGRADHSARLNIYGPPGVRAAGPVRVVAGDDATVHCPYTGYPISEISWWRRGGGGPLGGAGRVSARGAALRLAPALAADAGHYTCVVAAGQDAPAARRDIEIQVSNPPKISPFMFSSELTEGSSAQVLCGVSSGDRPLYFTWLKDGAVLPPDLQVEEKSLNEFSLLMFSELSARHAGAYTCRVSNHAAVANYTATLNIKVSPAWTQEPGDAAVVLGAAVRLACAARGQPPPAVTWYRRSGGAALADEQWAPAEGARGGMLEAPAAARALQGLYRCVADNAVGPPLIKHVNLTVHEPAQFSAGAGNVSSERGRGVALWCEARGDVPLAVHWEHRGARLDLGSYRWVVSEERRGGALRSTLRLRAVESADAGEYRCQAHNHYGTHQIIMYLQVEEPPPAPAGVRLDGVGARWVRVEWRAQAPAPAQYSALCTALQALGGAAPPHAQYKLTLASGAALAARLTGLRPATAYALRLAASNSAGRSPHSEPVLFTTLEEAPSAPPQNVRVTSTGSDELHVSWSAPAQDSWNGELFGYVARWVEAGPGGREGRVAARGWSSAELTLSGLLPAARYAVSLRAYNRAGAGPSAPDVLAATLDGGLEAPVSAVTCEPLAGDSLRVQWRRSPALAAAAASLRGYDVHYFPVLPAAPWREATAAVAQSAAGGGAAAALTLHGLQPATNYSVWVRARATPTPPTPSSPSSPSAPVFCITGDDVPGPVTSLRALAAGADALLVTWLAPARAGALTHYTLHARELGKGGGEWAQRVEAGGVELVREVRPLRAAVHAVWVVAHAGAGAAPPSRLVTAAPAEIASVRISSFGREVVAARGAAAALPCAAVGAGPLRRRWTPPPPPAHSFSHAGALLLHEVTESLAGNYTCWVRNADGAASVTHRLRVRAAPAAPVPRLQHAELHALHIAWNAPRDNGAPVLGYWVVWARWEGGAEAGRRALPRGEGALVLRGLACGAQYRITLQAHNALGTSPLSAPLQATTKGDRAVAALGSEFVWANSTALRLNLLAWRAHCPAPTYSVALRRPPAPFAPLPHDAESALASRLAPATWYEVRVVARSSAGDTVALYRAATLAASGERIGEPAQVRLEARASEGSPAGGAGDAAGGRAGTAAALLGGSVAVLLAALTGAAVVRRRGACGAAARGARGGLVPAAPHAQLYSTEPAKRKGKVPPSPGPGSLEEISPYATFSMTAGACGEGAECAGALHLGTTFGHAAAARPAPSPRLRPTDPRLPHAHAEYGEGPRDSDSESSGSACAACAPPPAPAPAAAARHRRRRPPPPTTVRSSTAAAATAAATAAAPATLTTLGPR